MNDLSSAYKGLSAYYHNKKLSGWHKIYQTEPPIYWRILYFILSVIPKEFSFVEIGSGYGDILYLAHQLKFQHIMGFERDYQVYHDSLNLIQAIGGDNVKIMNENWTPNHSQINCDILVSINNVYQDSITCKEEYLNKIYRLANWSSPKICLIELISDSFKKYHPAYPHFLRVNDTDIKNIFRQYKVSSVPTYIYPKNTSTKNLYIVYKDLGKIEKELDLILSTFV